MSRGRAVLKAITNRDYRRQIECLLEDGWSASRTGKNHFRLSHPLAHQDVITSGTPSDFRATENLKSQCRRALLPPAGDIIPTQPIAIVQMPKVVEDACSRRKPRWNDADRKSRKARQDVTKAPATAAGCFPIRNSKPDLLNMNDKVHRAILAEADARKAGASEQSGRKPDEDIAKNDETIKECTAMSETSQNSDTQAVAPVLSLVTNAPAPATSGVPPVGAAQVSALPRLDADLLAVAIRVLSGELRGIAITPDMVGKTLVLGAEAWIVDGAIPSMRAPAAPSLHPDADRPRTETTPAPGFPDDEPAMLALREALDTFKGSWLPLSDIMSLIPKSEGANDRAHKENIRRRLNHLTAIGHISRKQSGSSPRSPILYCKAA